MGSIPITHLMRIKIIKLTRILYLETGMYTAISLEKIGIQRLQIYNDIEIELDGIFIKDEE